MCWLLCLVSCQADINEQRGHCLKVICHFLHLFVVGTVNVVITEVGAKVKSLRSSS